MIKEPALEMAIPQSIFTARSLCSLKNAESAKRVL